MLDTDKIQHLKAHDILKAMVVPKLVLASGGSSTAMLARHSLQLKNKLDACALNAMWGSFPYCIVDIWNHIPLQLLSDNHCRR